MSTTSKLKLPPHDLDAEQSVIGSLLINPDAVISVVEILGAGDFYKEAHGHIYDAILTLYERREPIDLVTLTSELNKRDQLDAIGGKTYLSEIIAIVPTSANVEFYAKIVANKSVLRKLITTATNIAELGYKEEEEVDTLLDKAESSIFKIAQAKRSDTFSSIREILTDSFERIDELHRNRGAVAGVATGFIEMDKLLGGMQRSDMIVLAARPSMGKTSLGLNIAQNIALKTNIPVGIFSLEMSKEQLVDRLLCSEANVSMTRLRTGYLSDDDFARIGESMGILAEAPLYIDDTPGIGIMEMRAKARRLQAEVGIGFIVIDYLQLMQGRSLSGGSDNRVQEVSEISRGIKGLARELRVPIIAISQLSRAVEQRTSKIPMLSDLRESGSIEQDADVVMFIYREDYYNPDCNEEEKNIAKVIISKHRNGPTGQFNLYFKKEQTRFENLASDQHGPVDMA